MCAAGAGAVSGWRWVAHDGAVFLGNATAVG